MARFSAALVICAIASGGVGCWAPLGGDDDDPGSIDQGSLTPLPLGGDLVFAGTGANEAADSVPPEELSALGEPGTGGPPKVFYLAYADGNTSQRNNPNPCRGAAPKFVCEFAPTLPECQRQIQAYLDKWYAGFNVVFTLTRPTSGVYYTEVISSGGGAWCDAAANVAGVAPFLCEDLASGVAYTFLGGKSAKETAIIIAQEQAHLVGLEHTLSTRDIMDPTICPNCDGFENVENKIQNDHCNRGRQNSYQMMQDRMGIWTRGIKPTPFGCEPDVEPPLAQILSPADNANVAENFVLRVQASDKCKVSHVTVSVMPMGLKSQSTAPPFQWTLSKISGRQTITVTAFDSSGKASTTEITVRAGGSAGSGSGGRGGTVDGGSGGSTADGGGGEDSVPAMVPGDTSREAGCQLGGCGVGGDLGGAGGWTVSALWLAFLAFVLRHRAAGRALRRTAPIRATPARPRRQS